MVHAMEMQELSPEEKTERYQDIGTLGNQLEELPWLQLAKGFEQRFGGFARHRVG